MLANTTRTIRTVVLRNLNDNCIQRLRQIKSRCDAVVEKSGVSGNSVDELKLFEQGGAQSLHGATFHLR